MKISILFLALLMAVSCTKSVESLKESKPTYLPCPECKLDTLIKRIVYKPCAGCKLDTLVKRIVYKPCPGCVLDSTVKR